jgi:hypothetical protein
LQGLLGGLRQAVNACHEHILDSVRHHNLCEGLSQPIALPLSP